MAIGIIAVAFVTLLSLLPAGLNTYRAAIDEANTTWIIQSMNSMVQTSDYARIPELDFRTGKDIFYFDEEGKMTDRAQEPSSDPAVIASRIYAVKLLVGDLFRPDGNVANVADQKMPHGLRIILVISPVLDPKAMVDFANVDDVDKIDEIPAGSKVQTRAFYAARMDSQPISESTPTP
jgi:uncharacterized protein (TIGR02598 family)